MKFETGKILKKKKRKKQRKREVFGHRRPEKVDDDLTLHAKTKLLPLINNNRSHKKHFII